MSYSIGLLVGFLVGAMVQSMAVAAEVLDPRTSVAHLNESILFYASFDHESVAADLATGSAQPIRTTGSIRFVDGRFGRALLIGAGGGGGTLTFSSVGHIDLRRPGAISFWVRPSTWKSALEPKRDYVVFFRLPMHQGQFVVERMGFDRKTRRVDRLIGGVFDVPTVKRLYVGLDGTEHWDPTNWHLVVLNWTPDRFEISLDGGPFERRSSPGLFLERDATEGMSPPPFDIGGPSVETTAIDEITIYAHELGPMDVDRLLGR